MYHTDLEADMQTVDWEDPKTCGVIIGVTESQNGVNWNFANDEPSIALQNNRDAHKVLETAFVLQIDDSFYMYYTGYPQGADGVDVIVSDGHIYLSTSEEGTTFERSNPHEAVLEPVEDYDVDGVFSPSVVFHSNKHYMIYSGWSLQLYGYGIFGAVSEDGGLTWQKEGSLLITESDVPWALDNPRSEAIFYTILNIIPV